MGEKKQPLQAQRGRYYQEIAAAFLRLRGAPFVLSSQDMVMISSWEAAGIPLGVAQEGIRRAYESSRRARPGAAKFSALVFCDREVRRAFQEHKDRRIGRTATPVSRARKAAKARAAVEAFLSGGGADVECLRPVYEQALGLLARRRYSEPDLEKLDEESERLILESAGGPDREEVERRVRADFPDCPSAELARISALELVRRVRERHAIPRLSLFYY
jgi:hypothetical protein